MCSSDLVGLAVPMMREVVAIKHQWDADFVIDAAGTTATFGLTATPWDEVVAASAGAAQTGTARTGTAPSGTGTSSAGTGRLNQ